MNQKEVTELKKRFTKDSCTFPRVCGIYVDVGNRKAHHDTGGYTGNTASRLGWR